MDTVRSSPWVRSLWWDCFWMMSGLWALVPILALARVPGSVELLVTVTLVTLWLAHRAGTAYLAFTRPEYRELIRTQYVRFLVIPIATFAVFAFFFFDPLEVVPLTPLAKGKVALTGYFFVNSIHFAYQHYGVASIYRMRGQQRASDLARRLEKLYCVLVAGVVVTVGLVLRGSLVLDSTLLPDYWTTSHAAVALRYARVWGPAASIALTGWIVQRELELPRPSLPKTFYLLSVGLQGVLVFWIDPLVFFILWSIQHWLVAIGLTTRMASGSAPRESAAPWYRLWGFVNGSFWGSFLMLVLISVVMAPLFGAASNPEKFASLGAFLSGHRSLLDAVLTLSVGSAFVHLDLDRAVFRFSNEAVRKVSLPLMLPQRPRVAEEGTRGVAAGA